MGKILSPLVKQELANLSRDPDRRRISMNVLKTYVELLDTKTIPLFLAEVSDFKQSKSSRQHAISLYEVLARTHGKNIIPHIGKIMGTVVKALSSSAGSLPLQQSCARVVLSIARYGIDPLSTESQREGIIRGLCSPLVCALMNKVQPLAAGAALCLQALVESESWKFASVDIVNEVCLRVTAALEEKGTQTAAHMSLVCSLVKSDSQILEAHARVLIKAGINILEDGVSSESWQLCVDAVHMINNLLKLVDIRFLGSELPIIVACLDRCCLDRVPSLRDAIVEALQTVNAKASEKGSTDLVSCQEERIASLKLSPGHKFQRRRSLWGETDPSCGSSKTPTYGSCGSLKTPTYGSQESCFVSYTPSSVSSGESNNLFYSSPSMQSDAGQQDYGYNVNKVRKQMQFANGGVDISLKDGILPLSTHYDKNGEPKKIWSHISVQHNCEDTLKNSRFNVFHGFGQFDTANGDQFANKSGKPTLLSDKDIIERGPAKKEGEKDDMIQKNFFLGSSGSCWSRQHSPLEDAVTHQMSRFPLTVEDFHIFTTPKKIIRSLQQASPESACVKRHAINEHEDQKYETSSEAGWAAMDDVASSRSDYELSKRPKGNITVALKAGVLLDDVESVVGELNESNALEGSPQQSSSLWSTTVNKTGTVSSTFSSSSLCLDDRLEGKLFGTKPVKVLKGYNGASNVIKGSMSSLVKRVTGLIVSAKGEWGGLQYVRSRKEKSGIQFVLRGFILVVLVFSAALMAAKCPNMQQEYHLLVPT